MPKRPLVITCPGSSPSARLAAEIAHELESQGLAEPTVRLEPGQETIAIDGCPSACSSRLAAAQGATLVATVNLSELGVLEDDARQADGAALATRVSALVGRGAQPVRPARPHRPEKAEPRPHGPPHAVEDYLLALDALTSPAVECGVLITDSPTLASHVSDVLGVTRAAAGEMLAKMEAAGLVRRGPRKELLLTQAGRELADASARQQRLLEVFVTETLGYGLAESFERARALRPAFDDDAVDRLERSLGAPERCPHGWPVDPARSREESSTLRTLVSLAIGEDAEVARLVEDDSLSLRRLSELGIAPFVGIRVEERRPDENILAVDGRRIELDARTSGAVFVAGRGLHAPEV